MTHLLHNTLDNALQVREIKQFCFHAWPDHGAPDSTKDLLDFYWMAKVGALFASAVTLTHSRAE